MAKKENAEADARDLIARQLDAAIRRKRLLEAQKNLLSFIQFMLPDAEEPDNIEKSRYVVKPHHALIIDMFEKATSRENMFSALSIPPQHGKTWITSRFGPSWFFGNNSGKHIIVATYNATYAARLGSAVQSIFKSKEFKQVFPNFRLKRGSDAKDLMETEDGGSISFVGRGEGTTGRPCDFFIIDDPIKDKKEADSDLIRNDMWDWYLSVADTRCHILTSVFVIHTRWHEDDLIGRLCDPDHPEYDKELADDWTHINVPALFDQQDKDIADLLGFKIGDALWEEKFPVSLLQKRRKRNPKIFSALYQGRPTPDEGVFFTADMILEYSRENLPKGLRMYASSDHALTEETKNDANVFLAGGVDENGEIWLVDCWWKRALSDKQVATMISMMKKWRPMFWGAGKDQISKAIGPFLKKIMRKEKVYCKIEELPDNTDKEQKAQSIHGLMSLGMVHFPKGAPWLQNARRELLKFPNGRNDDFVDAIANLGRLVDKMTGSKKSSKNENKEKPKSGSLRWLKGQTEARKSQHKVIQGGM